MSSCSSVRFIEWFDDWPNKRFLSFLLTIACGSFSSKLFNLEIVEIVVKNFPSSVRVRVVRTVLFAPKILSNSFIILRSND